MLRGEARALVSIDLRGNVRQVLQGEKPYIGWAIPSRDGKHLAMWQSTGGSMRGCWKDFRKESRQTRLVTGNISVRVIPCLRSRNKGDLVSNLSANRIGRWASGFRVARLFR